MKKTKKRGKNREKRNPSAGTLAALALFLLCIALLVVAMQKSHAVSVKLPSGAPLPSSRAAEEAENGETPLKTPTDGDGISDAKDTQIENEDTIGEGVASSASVDIPEVPLDSDTAAGAQAPENTVGSEEPTNGNESESGTANEPIPHAPHVSVSDIFLSVDSVSLTVGESHMPIVTMSPADASDKGEIWTSDDPQIAVVNGYGNITAKSAGACTVTATSRENPAVAACVSVTVKERVEPQVTYINGILIANKSYPLPSDYNPGTDPTAKAALDTMIAAAAQENISLWSRSGFRSYDTQKILYDSYARRDGAAAADRYSARPGYSEHQTGLAFDLNSLSQSFAETAEGKWLAAHCTEYGFIIRYPKDKEDVTGYLYEPWHVRYLGIDTAKAVADSGLTLEEYLGITSAYAS